MVFRIMIVDSILNLVEQDPLVGHNHDELVALHAIINNTVFIYLFAFNIESMFLMHLLSNQTVPNPVRFASVLMIHVPVLQWTQTNLPYALRISFTSSLFIITFTVDWLFSSSYYGMTAFSNPWVSFPIFRTDFSSVSPRMRLSIPVIPASIVSGLLIFPRLLVRTA